MNEFVTLISTYGFPIACCIFMFWRETKTMSQTQELLGQVKEVINNNTNIITTFINDKEQKKE